MDELPHVHALRDRRVELERIEERRGGGEAPGVHRDRRERQQVLEHVAGAADQNAVTNEAAPAAVYGRLVFPDDEQRELIGARERRFEVDVQRAERHRRAARGCRRVRVDEYRVDVRGGILERIRARRRQIPRRERDGVAAQVEPVEHPKTLVGGRILVVVEVDVVGAHVVAGKDADVADGPPRKRAPNGDVAVIGPHGRRAGDVGAPALVAGAADDDGVGHVDPVVEEIRRVCPVGARRGE